MATKVKDENEKAESKIAKESGTRSGGIGSAAGDAIGAAGSWPARTRGFLEDVRAETRRVTWPTFKQVQATTVVVLVTVAFFGAYLGLLDYFFTRIISWILKLGQ